MKMGKERRVRKKAERFQNSKKLSDIFLTQSNQCLIWICAL